MTGRPLRIALFAPGLGLGGAERQLVNLAIGLHKRGHQVDVLTLYGGEHQEVTLREADVPTICLVKHGKLGALPAVVRMLRYLESSRTQILYSFHGLPNLMSEIAGAVQRRTKVVIGVRGGSVEASNERLMHRIIHAAEARMAIFADLVISNSNEGQKHAILRGYPASKICTVPNGIDTTVFLPAPAAGADARRKLNIGTTARVVGLVARMDPVKGHPTFLQAAAILNKKRSDICFVCVWDGDPVAQSRLEVEAEQLGLGSVLSWVRGTSDLVSYYNAMDIAVLPSWWGEGFPNAIGEAMACGRPCVASDLGDIAAILGEFGILVPPRNASALADAIELQLKNIESQGEALRTAVRDRVTREFGLQRMVERTERKLEALAACR